MSDETRDADGTTRHERIPAHSRAHGRRANGSMRIAMIGTRGVPAAYGGFETAVEEIGRRLVERGHEVTVYCRTTPGAEQPKTHLGMKLVHLPALRAKTVETLSHTALSTLHLALTKRHDAAFVFNAANSPFVPFIRAKGVPTAVHVDGLEWMRGKWSGAGKRYYRWAEQQAVHTADALISDAVGIVDYYEHQFGVPTELLTYGAKILEHPRTDLLASVGVEAGRFHVAVARFEPENHVDLIVEGYSRSDARFPLLVVGSAPYGAEYSQRIADLAAADPRVRLLGGVWDQELLDQLYANALTYLHGHSVGGTNPSLLRAMGAGTAVIAFDANFNHEVVGPDGAFFASPADVASRIDEAEADHETTLATGRRLQSRAAETYRWEDVADGYEALALRLTEGSTIRGTGRYTRTDAAWAPNPVHHPMPHPALHPATQVAERTEHPYPNSSTDHIRGLA